MSPIHFAEEERGYHHIGTPRKGGAEVGAEYTKLAFTSFPFAEAVDRPTCREGDTRTKECLAGEGEGNEHPKFQKDVVAVADRRRKKLLIITAKAGARISRS